MIDTRKALVPALVAVVLAVPAVRAEDRAKQDDEKRQDEKTEYVFVKESYIPDSNTIATKLSVPLQLTPANVGTVDGRLIEDQAAVVLGEALTNVSGLHVQPGSGVHDYFLIRGFDSLSSGLVLTDGAAEPEVGFYPMYNVEGIEVMKGPGGFLYGTNPLAGVVNVVRKQPVPSDFLHVGGGVGSFGTVEGNLDWNLSSASGARSFRLNGFWTESDGFRDDKDSRHFALNPSFSTRIGKNGTLNVNLEHARADYAPDSGLPLYRGAIPDVPRKRSYQSPFDFSEQEVRRFQVDYQTRIGDGLTVRNKTYYRELDWRTNGTLFLGVAPPPFPAEVSRILNLLDDRQRFAGNQLELILTGKTGRVSHELLFGLETAYLTDRYELQGALLPNIDLFDPVETAQDVPLVPFPVSRENEAPSGDSKTWILAPYVIDQMRFSDRLRLMLGARLDQIDFEDDLIGVSRDTGKVSPMAGLLFSPTADLSIYANAARSFAPPSPRVLLEGPKAEEGLQLELGAKKRFLDGKLRTTFAIYELERDNIAIPDDNGITQQTGDQRSRGLEVELAAEPGNGTHAFLSYAYNDAELIRFAERVIVGFDGTGAPIFGTADRAGNRPAFAPEHLARLWVSHSFRNRLGVGGGVRFFSDQFIAEDNLFELDGVTVVDATVFYSLPACRVSLNIKNLTDEEYATRGFGSASVIPADPFSATLSFEYRLR